MRDVSYNFIRFYAIKNFVHSSEATSCSNFAHPRCAPVVRSMRQTAVVRDADFAYGCTRDSPRMPRSCDAARSPSHDAARSYIQIGDYCFSITIISVVTPSSLRLSVSPSLRSFLLSSTLNRAASTTSFAPTYALTYARDYEVEHRPDAPTNCDGLPTYFHAACTLVNPLSPLPGR